MDAAARSAGTVVSAVMFGAVAGSGLLPFGRDVCAAVIRAGGRGADASLAGFALGFDAMDGGDAIPVPATAVAPVEQRQFAAFPEPVREFVALGDARLVEFQDRAYADLYIARLAQVLAAERAADPSAAHGFALTREAARFLALWMAFDDVVRVAGLQSRASRFARVRREVAARDDDVVRIVDYFKPGVPEFAGLLPAAWAARLVGWDRRRQARGKPPLSFALHLKSDTILGFVALRLLARRTGMRRRGARFAQEQALIERWLAAVADAAATDWSCAFELVLCGRLIKGYGATNDRAKQNLAHIVDQLAAGGAFASHAARAGAIRQAREAELKDEGGTALDQALIAHGVAARPVVAQPIRWSQRRPAAAAPAERTGSATP
jgi:indolepyruvate ferredoxin oxidoreductase beta subunit